MSSQSDRPLTLAEPGAAGRKLGRPNRLPSPVSRSPSSSESSWFSPGSPFPQIRATQGSGSPTAHGEVRCCSRSASCRSRGSRFSGSWASCATASANRRTDSFATVFLGRGLLFVGTLFVAAAVAAGLVASVGDDAGSLLSSDAWDVGRRTTHELMVVYAIRMAAVFTIATTTILMRTRLAPQDPRRVRLRDRELHFCSQSASSPGSSSRSRPGCSR